jgi:hypothetical protein
VPIRKLGFAVGMVLFAASPLVAQQFAVGASYGWFNDVESGFHFDDFHSPEWEGWVQTKLGEEVVFRLTYGSMRVLGDNVGHEVGPVPVVMPEYRDRIQYVAGDISYVLPMGPFTSGFFAGIGGYGVRPEEVSPELDPYRDQRERVIGIRVGAEGDLRVYGRFSLIGRLTYHALFTDTKRSLLVASFGALYRF